VVWWCPKDSGDRLLIDNLSFRVPPGAIVGVIGPNGAGKTTLFRLITGKEKPDAGEVVIGHTAQLAVVDQTRESLPNDKTAWEAISHGQDILTVGRFEMPSRAYLGRFNFKGPDQQKNVGALSGGERGRLHLAATLLQGGNVLLLDEPSNDLDVETLRALEEALLEFAGSVMVISHDRWFSRPHRNAYPRCRGRLEVGVLRRKLPGVRGRQGQATGRRGGAAAPPALQASHALAVRCRRFPTNNLLPSAAARHDVRVA
jgi:ATPase subunit of ABC transporter with duplicated ATPase domains